MKTLLNSITIGGLVNLLVWSIVLTTAGYNTLPFVFISAGLLLAIYLRPKLLLF